MQLWIYACFAMYGSQPFVSIQSHHFSWSGVSTMKGFYSQALVVVRRNCGCWLFLHRVAAPSKSLLRRRTVAKILQYLAPGLSHPTLSYNNTSPVSLEIKLFHKEITSKFLWKNEDLLLIMLVPSAKKWVWGHLIIGSSSKAGVANNSHTIHEIQCARAMKYNLFPDRNTNAFLKEMSISPKEAVVLIGGWQRGAVEMICSPVAEEFDSASLSAYISA